MLDKFKKAKFKVNKLSRFSIFITKAPIKINSVYKLLNFIFNLSIKDVRSNSGISVLSINSFKFYNYLFKV